MKILEGLKVFIHDLFLKVTKQLIRLCWVLVVVCGIFFFFFRLWHVGSRSLTRDRTQVPCIGSAES